MALITRADIENELQQTLPTGFTDSMVTEICDYADAMLKQKTRRVSFTGVTSYLAKYAEVCFAVDRMTLTNRDLMKPAIQSISENGASITFTNGKTLESYRIAANELVSELRLCSEAQHDIVQPDFDDAHTGDEGNYLYASL